MAVEFGSTGTDEHAPVKEFDEWYSARRVDPRTGVLTYADFTACAKRLFRQYDYFKREMDTRVKDYWKYEKHAAAEVVSRKDDLPNVSSGDSAGFIERIAKNIIQHTPKTEIKSPFEKQSIPGVLVDYFLTHKIVGDDEYSNDMQQNLTASVESALTLGFDCVIPVLLQDAKGSWYIQYDNLHYRDVFPEPGAKDVRRATEVFVRRYLTKGEIKHLIRSQVRGWDHAALLRLLQTAPSTREHPDHESHKHGTNPEAYEVITWYSNSGDPFLTYDAQNKLLLRIEKNKHPLKEHPVHFLILKKDAQQPLGKSVLAKTYGRQEFQDRYLNGAMKLWALNVNPPIFGFGTTNTVPNLAPGKFTQFSNPESKVQPFEISTQSLMMFGTISQQNSGNMAQLIGNADQQMASQNTGGMMSQTPQGVEAQQQMVDITTNQFQKAVEVFLSKYLSYALTIYFQELKGLQRLTPDAHAREDLLNAGLEPEAFSESGEIQVPFSDLAILYHVKVVAGSLVEMEEEKQTRLLNQMFIPLSQAMPALGALQNPQMLEHAAAAMQFIIQKQIELTGSNYATDVEQLIAGAPAVREDIQKREELAALLGGVESDYNTEADLQASVILQQQQQISLLMQGMQKIMEAQGIQAQPQAQQPLEIQE